MDHQSIHSRILYTTQLNSTQLTLVEEDAEWTCWPFPDSLVACHPPPEVEEPESRRRRPEEEVLEIRRRHPEARGEAEPESHRQHPEEVQIRLGHLEAQEEAVPGIGCCLEGVEVGRPSSL